MTGTSPSQNENKALQDINNTIKVHKHENQMETDSQSDKDYSCTKRKSGHKRLSKGENKWSTKWQQYLSKL